MNDKFVCDTCGTVDRLEFAYPDGKLPTGEFKCTQCQTGTWHHLTTKRAYDPSKDLVVNRPSGLGLS
ncbi:hypothetical protein LUCX_45 [Xanthomonas phage vB_XciM_LucasX]|nr:hypothetical protein LUCX_45 [Xanthomonas phage vB_XciM_LucasX]